MPIVILIRFIQSSLWNYNRIQRHKPRSDFTQVAIFEKSKFFIQIFFQASYDLPVAENKSRMSINGPEGPASKKDRFVQQTVKIQEMAVELQNPSQVAATFVRRNSCPQLPWCTYTQHCGWRTIVSSLTQGSTPTQYGPDLIDWTLEINVLFESKA